jgi:hypothetical protein
MPTEFCPRCGTARTGAFRFCRSCQFDFEGQGPEADPVIEPSWSVVPRPPASTPISPPPAEPSKPEAPQSSKSVSPAAIIAIVAVIAVLIDGAVFLTRGGGTASVSPENLPPAGTIWFGSNFDPNTFAIAGRLASVTTNQGFSFVAHLTRPIDASAMGMRISWNGQVVATNAVNAKGTGDVWGFTPAPIFSAGTWKYELTDVGGNVLASGSITVN